MIKNVLRYPGGKSKALDLIIPKIPNNIQEFREPMAGGGSVSLAIKQLYPHVNIWINTSTTTLFAFGKHYGIILQN